MTSADTKAVARVMAEAFYDDPLLGWMIPDPVTRLGRLERVFALVIRRFWLPRNECYVPTRLIGAAMWMPPGTWKPGRLAEFRMLPGYLRALGTDIRRMSKLDTFVEQAHPPDPPHWYLAAMGVTPAWQSRGYGTVQLRPVLERCDAERVPAYLETSTPGGRRLYERHGFQVLEECDFEGRPVWLMWREPQR